MQNTIPIVLISDDNYCLATSVAVESIIRNKKPETNYEIYILGIDISKENKDRLESQSKDKAKVTILEFENKYKDINYSHSYISKVLFFKFDVANIFSQYNKIIYLDGDIAVNGDLTEFFETDLGNNYAGVVKDLILFSKKQHQIINTESYFNAGVMLLNAKKIREENLYPKFLEELTTHNYEHSDQDVFNIMFNKQAKFLSLKFNFISLYYMFNKSDINSQEELNDFKTSAKQPIIIHYAGDKPWNLKKGKKFEIWKKYFKLSPYKKEKLKWQKNKKMFEFDFSEERKKIRLFGLGFSFKCGDKH